MVVKRQAGHVARAAVSAIAAAAGLMALASTGQTPDGFVHANFGSPLGLFGGSAQPQADVLSIGDGSTDPTELAALLNTAGPTTAPGTPLRVTVEPGATPNANELRVLPTIDPAAAPTIKQSQTLNGKPVVDSQGRVDCTNAVKCETDPATQITTVTYADGVVALVQKINDMTVIAYQNVGEALKGPLQAILPSPPKLSPPPIPAAASPDTAPPVALDPRSETAAGDPGPAVPVPDITASTVRPRVTVTRPPGDFSPGSGPSGDLKAPSVINPSTVSGALDAVKGAVSSVVGAIGKALSPGASTAPDAGDK